MNRGRILQALSRANLPREGGNQRHEDSILPRATVPATTVETPDEASQPQEVEQPATARALRGRGGRILSRLAALSVRSEPGAQATGQSAPRDEETAQAVPPRRPPSDSSGSGDHPPARNLLVRQDSDLSRSSVVSQQFVDVERDVNYKACLPKAPSMAGAPVKLGVNYMTFETSGSAVVEEYHVDFSPNIESIRLRYTVLRSEEAKAVVGRVIHWTGTNLYLPIKLPDRVTTFTTNHPVNNTPLQVSLTYIKCPPDSELLPFYNSLMHKVMNKLQYVIINRRHYSPMSKISIDQYKLEVWPGWVTSIQRLDGGLKLSVDASFRVLRLETVRDIMMEIRNRNRGMNLKEAFEQELVGAIIMTRYNNRSYRIDEIDLTKKPSDTFLLSKENRQITYIEYMSHHWNVQVRDPMQPMIVHRPKPKRGHDGEPETIYLIPELCCTTGLTDEMRSNFNIMKSLDACTKLPPDLRESKLMEFLQQLSTNEAARTVLEEWNLRVRPELDIVDGRRLPNEKVVFGNGREVQTTDDVDWTRYATTSHMFKSVPIENWVVMYPERESATAKEFLDTLRQVSGQLNIQFKPPRVVKLPNDSAQTYVNAGKSEVKRTDQIVVLLTPGKSQREDRYSACKRLFSCDIPVSCQFIRCGTVSNPRKLKAITQKVVIQMLSKVGGQPWAMKFPMQSFMIVGMDVYHDTIDRKKSCVGFVASMNNTTSAWWSQTFFQSSLEEIGQKVSNTLVCALQKFHSINGYVPQKIIIYRDGVGDGQLDVVLQCEVVQVVNAVKFYMRDCNVDQPEPHISYVVCQKRIGTKMSLREYGRTLNPLPGTFLDHTITHPEYNDFYLVAQHVNQGTVAPTKYIVLTETGTLKVDHHQKLAYKMTHMYYNWCGTIRVPAPCQYAHKLAYLTGQNIRQQANERLQDKLYYL